MKLIYKLLLHIRKKHAVCLVLCSLLALDICLCCVFSAFTFNISNSRRPTRNICENHQKDLQGLSRQENEPHKVFSKFSTPLSSISIPLLLLLLRETGRPSMLGSVLLLWLIFPDIFLNHELNCK